MIARAYYADSGNMVVRVSKKIEGYHQYIAGLPLNAATPESADFALRQINLRRNGPWKHTEYGREAQVYFVK